MLRRAVWLTGVLVLVLLLALGGAAGAKKRKKKKRPTHAFTTHATLEFTPPETFTGTVSATGQPKSDREMCVQGRAVTLLYYGPNAAPRSRLSESTRPTATDAIASTPSPSRSPAATSSSSRGSRSRGAKAS
jgi:hypothetical protein